MAFSLEFHEFTAKGGLYKIVIRTGDIICHSPPQAIDGLFRDLAANRHFLAQRKLIMMVLGDEPLFNINYADNDLIEAKLYERSKNGSRELRGEFLFQEAIAYLDGVLDGLEVSLNYLRLDKSAIMAQLRQDMSEGVYDIYLKRAI